LRKTAVLCPKKGGEKREKEKKNWDFDECSRSIGQPRCTAACDAHSQLLSHQEIFNLGRVHKQ
jgi:hypothetical protein